MSQSHSKAGIASFIISILNLAGLVIFLLYTNYSLESSFDPDTIISAMFSSIFAGIIFLVVLSVGFLLGVISLFMKDTKKLFGVLGILMCLISGIIFLILIAAFSMMSPGM